MRIENFKTRLREYGYEISEYMYSDRSVIVIDAGNPVTVTLQLLEQFKDCPKEIHSILRNAKVEPYEEFYSFILSNQPWEQ